MTMTTEHARAALAAQLDRNAQWRDRVAERHPDDERNKFCAACLRRAAAHVRALPIDDPRLIRLAALDVDVRCSREFGYRAGRYRFDHSDRRTDDEFVSELLDVLDAEAAA